MKRHLKLLLALLCASHFVAGQAQTTTPPIPKLAGANADVTRLNTQSLLTTMSVGSPNNDLVLVAAHRGYWFNAPENSTPALEAAFNSGVEVIEIDLRTTSDGVIVVSHDADLLKETNGSGFVNQTTWPAIQALQLRDRKGNPQNLQMLSFAQTLAILAQFSPNPGYGPVIIADIKDSNSWATYQAALNVLTSTVPSSLWPAVVFKMKMRNISVDPTVGISAQATQHSSYGHIVAVVNPEDSNAGGAWAPGSANFQTIYNLSQAAQNYFLQQFELNINSIGDGAAQFISGIGTGSPLLTSFATYYESKFYPEGVSTIFGGPNDTRVFNPNPPPPGIQPGQTFCCYTPNLASDLRGILDFSLYYHRYNNTDKVSLITADNLSDTLNLLTSLGLRNVSEIGN